MFIQELGEGVALTVLMDATLVHGLLVPVMMSLHGGGNDWAPPTLRALWQHGWLSEAEEVRFIAVGDSLKEEEISEGGRV